MAKGTTRTWGTIGALAFGAVLLATGASARATMLNLDFTNNAFPTGWNPVYGNFLADTASTGLTPIPATAYNFTINHVAVYDNGNATEPLTRSGFYTFGNETNDHTFTLSGLNPGDSVTLYATAAWDGNGRGAVIVFGNSGAAGVQAQTVGDPGTTPTVANFTLIGTATADASGMVSGTMNGAGGVGSATEGQVGGMIFDVNGSNVPEPASLGLLALGGLALLRRR